MLLEGGFLANWICDRALSCPLCCCGLQYPWTQLKHKYVGQLLLVHGIETLSLQLFSEGVVSVALKRFESGLYTVQLEWQAQTLKAKNSLYKQWVGWTYAITSFTSKQSWPIFYILNVKYEWNGMLEKWEKMEASSSTSLCLYSRPQLSPRIFL